MLSRCLNPNAPHYADYGGRGITVCERWREFSNFYADMGAKPPGLTLERIDNDKGYSPENCRWATREEQARNRRSNRLITYEGVTATLAETARRVGMGVTTLRGRLDAGWSVEEAITKPSRKWRTKEQACSI